MGSGVQTGDQWLASNASPIISAMSKTDALFIVLDTVAPPATAPLIIVSRLAKPGATSTAYTHESLLATVEEGLGLPKLGGAATATVIADIRK
jgi:hypothetical protein